MQRAYDFRAGGPVSEMAIVDTFTKLIFGDVGQFNDVEELIIEAFRLVEPGVATDGPREMGAYLQALEVPEMIELVAQVQHCLAEGMHPLPGARGESPLNRRAQ